MTVEDKLAEALEWLENEYNDNLPHISKNSLLMLETIRQALQAPEVEVVSVGEFNEKLAEWSTWKVWPTPFILERYPNGLKIVES